MNAGVDKLKLWSQEYCVTDATKIIRKQPSLSGDTTANPKPLINVNGEQLCGTGAFMNLNQGTPQSIQTSIEHSKMEGAVPSLIVTFNPSKYAYPDTSELLTSPDILGDVLGDVENTLREAGISTNLFNAKVSRIDITKQAEMKGLARDYLEYYDNLSAKFGRNVERKKCNADWYLLKGGKKWQFCGYDKGAEQTKEAKNPSRYLRNELRFFGVKTIKDFAGIYTPNDLVKETSNLTKTYNSFLEKRVFNRWQQGHQLEFDFEIIDNMISRYRTEGKEPRVMDIVSDFGILKIIETYNTIDNFLSRFAGDMSRTTYWRYQKKLTEKFNSLNTRQRQIITELKDAFLIAV